MAVTRTSRRVAAVCAAVLTIVTAGCESARPSPTVGQPDSSSSATAPAPTSSDVAAGTASPATTPEADPWDRPDPPLDVTVTTDADHEVAKTIGVKGGTLELSLPDGTTATLTVPPGAVIGPTGISMSSAAIDGWSFAPRDRAGVQLAPDGLQLLVPATLRFRRPDIGPDGTHGEVAWSGSGEGLRPIASVRDADAVTLTIEHFSGYALVWNVESEEYWTSWRKTAQRDAQAEMEADLVTVLRQEQQRQFLGLSEGPLLESVVSIVDRWYDVVYEPMMRDGETTCEGGLFALAAHGAMKRTLEQLGFDVRQVYATWIVLRKAGQSTHYPFDEIPDDYLDALTRRCDLDALAACRLTGDIGLLMVYVSFRNRSLFLYGKLPEDAEAGLELIEACARYRVDVAFEFGQDITFYSAEGVTVPSHQSREHWTIEFSVDLRYVHTPGTAPWIGTIEGEVVPTVKKLESRMRSRHVIGGDHGSVDKGWFPWCEGAFTFGPWHPWRLQLTALEFTREHRTRTVKVGLRYPRELTIEGQLATFSFQNAKLLFDEILGAAERYRYDCGTPGGDGSDPYAYVVMNQFIFSQPPDTAWKFKPDGHVDRYEVGLRDPTSPPLVLRREWLTTRSVDRTRQDGEVKWNGTIVFTHTPAAGP